MAVRNPPSGTPLALDNPALPRPQLVDLARSRVWKRPPARAGPETTAEIAQVAYAEPDEGFENFSRDAGEHAPGICHGRLPRRGPGR